MKGALNLIHTQGAALPVSKETVLHLHKLSRGEIWDAGHYKDKPVDIIEKLPTGGERLRFRSVAPKATPDFTRQLVALWGDQSRDRDIAPLIVPAAFNLDSLCIHPFRDGNGRVSRLLLLLTAYHLGIEVGRYVSLERLTEIESACPGVSRDWIRRILFELARRGKARCTGKGRAARWQYLGE